MIPISRDGGTARVLGFPKMVHAGLGHKMCAWARCHVWCKDNNVGMLAPRWFDVRVGPYLRREKEKRQYHRLFTNDGYVKGVRKAIYLATAEHVLETEAGTAFESGSSTGKLVV